MKSSAQLKNLEQNARRSAVHRTSLSKLARPAASFVMVCTVVMTCYAQGSAKEANDALALHHVLSETHRLIEAENEKKFESVRQFVWDSPSALFVAKTATAAEGNWADFWGYETVVQHLHDVIFGGPFHIDPDYTKAKAVLFTKDVAETYVPVKITVGYAGQQAVPRPFLLVMDWVKVGEGWKMASDIAIPVPLPPTLKP